MDSDDYPRELKNDEILIARINALAEDEDSSPNLFSLCGHFREAQVMYRDRKPAIYQRLSQDGLAPKAVIRLCSEFNQWIGSVTDDVSTEDCEIVIRNLTKKQFIRQIGTQASLGHALYSQICWSSDPSISMSCDNVNLHRGDWAGDRFESCSLATHWARVDRDETGSD